MATATRSSAATAAYNGPYAVEINAAARQNGLDPFLLAGLLKWESGGAFAAAPAHVDPNDAGIAGINLPSHPTVTRAQAETPAFAIPWAARYLAELKARFGGSTVAALRAYNTGSGNPSTKGDRYAAAVMGERASLLARIVAAVKGYVEPVPGGKVIRLDQGIDYQGPVGGPVQAIGNAVVDAVKSDPGGFGQVVYYTLTDGPKKGQQIYVGHAQPDVTAGEHLTAGQRVATLLQSPLGNATQPGWTEVGFAANGTPVSSSASDTGSASQFASLVGKIKSGVNAVTGNPFTPGGALGPGTGVTGAFDALKGLDAVGTTFGKFLDDPAYPFLWLGFMLGGLAFIFVGVERLLGRSAAADAKSSAGSATKAATVIAAPEAAPLEVGA